MSDHSGDGVSGLEIIPEHPGKLRVPTAGACSSSARIREPAQRELTTEHAAAPLRGLLEVRFGEHEAGALVCARSNRTINQMPGIIGRSAVSGRKSIERRGGTCLPRRSW